MDVVTSVTSTTDTTAAAAAMKKSMGMNKDDFLKLFIAQLQYQDPLKPQDPTAMLDQLSQLSLVEQAYNNNTALSKLLTAQNNTLSMESVGFIGKNVKASGNSISFDGTSQAMLQFNLPVPAATATIKISNSAGQVVRSATMNSLSAGGALLAWDGKDNSGALLPAGSYTFSVNATTATGAAVAATTYTTGKIDGVSLAGGTPVLTIGTVSVPLTDVVSVGV